MESKSELQVRLNEMESLAIATFGSKSKADSWLNKENITLGATPISCADSEAGFQEVKKILNAISYGGVV